MSGSQSGISVPDQSQEFVVRIPKNVKKRFNVMRFHGSLNVDVSKWNQVRMERENNLKDFKAAEEMPKFGAGSEYGREQREESRRKKYGIVMKKYNPEDQPWLLRTGGKAGKKYRGIREGGVAENASYYVFVKAPDGAFEAYQVDEWYNFTPVQRYKTLNAEEAEEEFGRRDHVLNYFSIMLRKRLNNNEEEAKEEDEGEKQKKKKDSKYGFGGNDLKISDMDDWVHSSDGDSDEDGIAEATGAPEKKADKNKKKQTKKKKKKAGSDDDDEGIEDSDDGDDEGREVDYISDESSSSEDEKNEKPNKDLQGVEDSEAIRKMEDSESEEENAEEKKENVDESKDEATPSKPAKEKKEQKKTASSSESSDTSDSDDFDNDTTFQSALFVPKSKRNKDSSSRSSRPNTPTRNSDGKKESKNDRSKGLKRKSTAVNNEELSGQPIKKSKLQAAPPHSAASTSSTSTPAARIPCDLSSDGITEDCVRRYLMRKPMTTTELLHKFKSKKSSFSREQLVNTLAQILKRLDPDKQTVKGKMYLSIKQS